MEPEASGRTPPAARATPTSVGGEQEQRAGWRAPRTESQRRFGGLRRVTEPRQARILGSGLHDDEEPTAFDARWRQLRLASRPPSPQRRACPDLRSDDGKDADDDEEDERAHRGHCFHSRVTAYGPTPPIRNVVNPTIGCRMQQACSAQVEQTVEVGRNDKDGTCRGAGSPRSKAPTRHVRVAREGLGVDTWCVCRWRDGL